jgi:hypothetical protein
MRKYIIHIAMVCLTAGRATACNEPELTPVTPEAPDRHECTVRPLSPAELENLQTDIREERGRREYMDTIRREVQVAALAMKLDTPPYHKWALSMLKYGRDQASQIRKNSDGPHIDTEFSGANRRSGDSGQNTTDPHQYFGEVFIARRTTAEGRLMLCIARRTVRDGQEEIIEQLYGGPHPGRHANRTAATVARAELETAIGQIGLLQTLQQNLRDGAERDEAITRPQPQTGVQTYRHGWDGREGHAQLCNVY